MNLEQKSLKNLDKPRTFNNFYMLSRKFRFVTKVYPLDR